MTDRQEPLGVALYSVPIGESTGPEIVTIDLDQLKYEIIIDYLMPPNESIQERIRFADRVLALARELAQGSRT